MESESVRRRFQLIREVFADSEVAGYESLVDLMRCHPKDRHVLAAAVWGNVDQIVTFNQKDFPEGAVTPYGIEVVSPDDFLLNILICSQGQQLKSSRNRRRTCVNHQ